MELLGKNREGGGLVGDMRCHTLGMTGQQLLGNDGTRRSSEDNSGPVARKVHDQSVGIVGVGLQAVLEVLLTDEKALRVSAAVPAQNSEVGGEKLGTGVEDAAPTSFSRGILHISGLVVNICTKSGEQRAKTNVATRSV